MTSVSEWVNAVRFCRWPDCDKPRSDDPEAPPLCVGHIIKVTAYGNRVVHRFNESCIASAPARRTRQPVVYYVRIGDHVKIGTSTDLTGRLKAMYVEGDAVLGTEPGGYDVEAQRHRQFDAERVRPDRELFNPSPRLLAHIESL